MKAMICATRLFGSAAAEYFYGGDHGYADALSAYLKEAGKTEAELAASAERYAFDAADAKLALVLDAKTAVRLYVAGVTPGTEADGYIAAANAAQADAPSYFEFTGLRPEDLSAAKTISVNGTAYHFSALSWCDRVLKSGLDADDKNVKMAKALLAYHQAGRELPVRTIAAELETLDDNYESYFIYIYFNYHEGQRWCDIDLPDEIVVDDKYLKWDREEVWLFICLEELDWGDRMIHTDEVIRSDGIYSWHDFDE